MMCLLETMAKKDGSIEYQCRTSEVLVQGVAEYIETDQCVKACGIDRKSVGISSDALLEPQFMTKLCSPTCYQKCPNIVELTSTWPPERRTNPHRAMLQLLSSGEAALAPSAANHHQETWHLPLLRKKRIPF
ncbi:PAR1 protein [Prunus dulcis]|uniref:PAR1 protein n=1 Tax=Prunus dulcis TaxID=3755 RepID=A0A4Y1RR49_PRUDU|nr:PAR1 protein [Prunus dulcis]